MRRRGEGRLNGRRETGGGGRQAGKAQRGGGGIGTSKAWGEHLGALPRFSSLKSCSPHCCLPPLSPTPLRSGVMRRRPCSDYMHTAAMRCIPAWNYVPCSSSPPCCQTGEGGWRDGDRARISRWSVLTVLCKPMKGAWAIPKVQGSGRIARACSCALLRFNPANAIINQPEHDHAHATLFDDAVSERTPYWPNPAETLLTTICSNPSLLETRWIGP